MTLREIYQLGKKQAQSGEIGAYCTGFDVLCLFEHCFGLDRQGLILHGGEPAPQPLADAFFSLLGKKAAGEPLQYLLSAWDFMGMALAVGPGVLIPREDTIPLVLEAARRLENIANPVVLDLCAGTGAVGLGIAKKLSGAQVVCVELSPLAFSYLEKNIARYGAGRVRAVMGDVLLGPEALPLPPADAVVSNPPYICSSEMPSLQIEVRKEPKMALDGGEDGLTFYRAIAQKWLGLLKPGGAAAVEIGNGQGPAVTALLEQNGVSRLSYCQDLTGADRVVAGNKNICL